MRHVPGDERGHIVGGKGRGHVAKLCRLSIEQYSTNRSL